MPNPTAAMLVIGDEILSGRTRDSNMNYLAQEFTKHGVDLREARMVSDDRAAIVEALNALRARYDTVVTSGGIGPTHDDITSACVAKAFGRKLIRHPDAEALLLSHYKPEDVTEARMKMADVAEDSILLENPVSRAPGFQVENVFVLPGVPRIMQAMFDLFKHRLVGGAEMLSKSIASYTPEGKMAARLTALQDSHPGLEIGSYPFSRDGKHGSTIVIRGIDAAEIDRAAETLRGIMRDFGNEPQEVDL